MTDSQLADAIASAARSGRLNLENTWVSRTRRYFYMAVSKAASSKIKMLLHQLEGYALPADPFDVHARSQPGMPFVDKLSAFGADEAVEILRGPDWRRFGFVRNPYARLYSAYRSKIANLASPYVGVRAAIWRMAGPRQPPAEAPPFEAFIRYLAQLPDLERDGHWRSQTGALCLDLIDYGFIGRVESLEADLATVLRSRGAPDGSYDGLDVVVGASARSPTAAAYDAGLGASFIKTTRPTSRHSATRGTAGATAEAPHSQANRPKRSLNMRPGPPGPTPISCAIDEA
jgi:Sulfotransferase family